MPVVLLMANRSPDSLVMSNFAWYSSTHISGGLQQDAYVHLLFIGGKERVIQSFARTQDLPWAKKDIMSRGILCNKVFRNSHSEC